MKHYLQKVIDLEFPNRAWTEISLDAIENNIKEIRRVIGTRPKILASVKADAYGHGFFEIAKTLLDNGVDVLGVAFIDEALQLRRNGFDCPVMILGNTANDECEALLYNDITPTVFSLGFAKSLSAAAVKLGKAAKIHIKVDTGMGRIGFVCNSNDGIRNKTLNDILAISKLPNIEIEGIFTHFARADEVDREFTQMQFARFMSLVSELEKNRLKIPVKHAANSAAIIQYPEMCLDMVRPGIAIYGCYPSVDVDKGDCDRKKIKLIPVMQFKTKISNLKWIEKGEPISYGGTFAASDKTKVATLPIGYADGYSRLLSNRGTVIANDKKVPIIGKICMDQCMIDATSVNNIDIGNEVILFGRNLNSEISVEEVANLCGTISYEILCSLGRRVPRVYTQDGKIVKILNNLIDK